MNIFINIQIINERVEYYKIKFNLIKKLCYREFSY